MMDLIAADRRELARVLGELTAEQWQGPSMCAGWTAAHVVAHLTMPFRISEQEFMAGLQQAGDDFTAFSDRIADRDSQLPQEELVGVLRDNADNPWSPPGGGLTGALSHGVIHGLDIAWPLVIEYPIADQAMTAVLNSVTSPPGRSVFGIGLEGIELSATDVDWSAGQGDQLTGRSRDLLLLVAGRRIPLERFDGPGVKHLAAVR
jgi:uncharacterized protein (TIGR03083 family)